MSTFQQEHPLFSYRNRQNGLMRASERRLLFNPPDGIYFFIQFTKTLATYKFTMIVSVDYPHGVPCGRWNQDMGRIFQDPAFSSFEFPRMSWHSPTNAMIVIQYGDHNLVDILLKGHRGDLDMTLERFEVHEWAVAMIDLTPPDEEGRQEPKEDFRILCAVFQGERIAAFSTLTAGKLFVATTGGVIMQLGGARIMLELRRAHHESPGSYGYDPDMVEFKFTDRINRLEVMTDVQVAPREFMVCSQITGPALYQTVDNVRRERGRVITPDHRHNFDVLSGMTDFVEKMKEVPPGTTWEQRLDLGWCCTLDADPSCMHVQIQMPQITLQPVVRDTMEFALADKAHVVEINFDAQQPVDQGYTNAQVPRVVVEEVIETDPQPQPQGQASHSWDPQPQPQGQPQAQGPGYAGQQVNPGAQIADPPRESQGQRPPTPRVPPPALPSLQVPTVDQFVGDDVGLGDY